MMHLKIIPIVEGDGEVVSVPILIRRFANETMPCFSGKVHVLKPIRQSASKLLKKNAEGKRLELTRIVELAICQLEGPGGIFILLDCEDDCPAQLGPELLACAKNVRPDVPVPVSVVLAHREYESWFLGSAASLAGYCGLPADLQPDANPESPRGCKEWLSKEMPRGKPYSELTHQPKFTAKFAFDVARQACPSFDRCCRDVTKTSSRCGGNHTQLY